MNEWIEINLPWGTSCFDEPIKESFCRKDLNKPGTLIEMKSGQKIFIGDINSNGGSCDCCPDVCDSDIVVRYVVIYEKK